jgi:hypothetical protein
MVSQSEVTKLVYNVRLRITVIHDYKKTYKHMPLLLASLQTHASIGNIPCIVIRVHVLLTIFGSSDYTKFPDNLNILIFRYKTIDSFDLYT